MNSQRTGLRVASIVFGVVCLVHIWRVLMSHFTVQIGSHEIPLWGSWLAVVVAGALSIWMWRLASARS